MKRLRTTMLGLVFMGLIFSLAYAAGNAESGKKLFNDPKLSSSTNDRSCNSCHPDGEGLAGMMEKPEWASAEDVDNRLVDITNQCITKALEGKSLPADSKKMQDIIAYIKSLN